MGYTGIGNSYDTKNTLSGSTSEPKRTIFEMIQTSGTFIPSGDVFTVNIYNRR